MNIVRIEQEKPVRARHWRHPPAKRNFINRVVSKLQKFGFVKLTTNAKWVPAPHIVPKPPPAYSRLAFDLCKLNTTKKPMSWPMPNLVCETSNMRESRCFASIDFTSEIWQMPLHIFAQPLHALMTDRWCSCRHEQHEKAEKNPELPSNGCAMLL